MIVTGKIRKTGGTSIDFGYYRIWKTCRVADDSIQIKLSELRTSIDAILRHLESVEGDTISVPYDYFWSVPSPERYEMSANPAALTVGQVSESWENLRRERSGDSERSIGFGAVWLGEVLTAVGHSSVG